MQHNLEMLTPSAWEIKAGRKYVAYCDSCNDPDGFGDGAVEFFGGTLSEVVEQYEGHIALGEVEKWED